MSCLLLLFLAGAEWRAELGGGLSLGLSKEVPRPIFLAAPGIGASALLGDSLFLTASVDADLALFAGASSPLFAETYFAPSPLSVTTAGAGWRFVVTPDWVVAIGAGAAIGMIPATDVDTLGTYVGAGIAPLFRVTWRLANNVGIAVRGQFPIYVFDGSRNSALFISVETVALQ